MFLFSDFFFSFNLSNATFPCYNQRSSFSSDSNSHNLEKWGITIDDIIIHHFSNEHMTILAPRLLSFPVNSVAHTQCFKLCSLHNSPKQGEITHPFWSEAKAANVADEKLFFRSWNFFLSIFFFLLILVLFRFPWFRFDENKWSFYVSIP